MTELLQTPLHSFHLRHGAKMVPFAGWDMPVQYPTGVMAEHKHTRAKSSLFDVSHMGQIIVRGTSLAEAAAALESLTPASVSGLKPWRQRYGLFTAAGGGILDDFMFANHEEYWFLVVNAARTQHDLGLLRQLPEVSVELVTERALIALQGPESEEELAKLVPGVRDLVFMDSKKLSWSDDELWISRSGYTGEDGFEISVPSSLAEQFVQELLADGIVLPAGLGARDSLRMEAGMPLYGHDLTEDITPAAAALAWSIPKARRSGGSRAGGYPGYNVIDDELSNTAPRLRVGLRSEGRAPVREGVELFATETGQSPIAVVTSGGFGPTVGGPIAMAMLPSTTSIGETVFAELRGKRIPLVVTDLPFIQPNYKR